MTATAEETKPAAAPQRRRARALRPVRRPEAGGKPRHPGGAQQGAAPAPAPDLRLLNGTILRLDRPQFADLANAYLHAHGKGEASEGQRAQLLDALPQMLLAFEKEHGAIVRSHLTATLAAACLTERDELVVSIGQRAADGPPNLVALLRRCERVGYTAWHRLHTYDRRSCQLQLWNVVEDALRLLDAHPSGADAQAAKRTLDDAVVRLEKRADAAEDFMLRCAARRTQARYLKGMLLGATGVGLVLGTTFAVLNVAGELTRPAAELLLVALAGSVGAVFSVLARMTSGSLQTNLPTLDHDMKNTDLRLIAALRPVVGLVTSLALYVLAEGGLVPIASGDGAKRTALVTGIAFLVGFSERLAQDVFIRSGNGLLGTMGDSPAKGPAAGLTPPPGARR
jgi:hypothetical protein